jgi:DNA-binding transcriptional LysR family regulator
MIDWNDYRYLLAVAEARTLSGAGRRLGVSHPTVYRRVRAMEQRLGVRLFDRRGNRYVLTAAGEDAVRAARDLSKEFDALERRLAGRDATPSGRVRLTAPDTLSEYLLPDILVEVRHKAPQISLEIVVGNEFLPLTRREADIALRASDKPPETLLGRRVGHIAVAPYGQRERVDTALDGIDPATATWIGFDDTLNHLKSSRWLEREIPPERVVYRANSLLAILGAARAGVALALLPCFLGDADASLARLHDPIAELDTPLWVLIHRDLRDVPRIRTVADALADGLRRRGPNLAGRELEPAPPLDRRDPARGNSS